MPAVSMGRWSVAVAHPGGVWLDVPDYEIHAFRKSGSTRWYFGDVSVASRDPMRIWGVNTIGLKKGGGYLTRDYSAMVTSPTPHMLPGLPRSARVLLEWLVLRDWTVLRSATTNGSRCCRHEIERLAANRPCWAPPGYPPTFSRFPFFICKP